MNDLPAYKTLAERTRTRATVASLGAMVVFTGGTFVINLLHYVFCVL